MDATSADGNPANNYISGVLAEVEFIKRATLHNINICLPFHHHSPYDVVIDLDNTLLKIQIKSNSQPKAGDRYKFIFTAGRNTKTMYHIDQVDYFACYAADINCFWILPMHLVSNKKSVQISPKNPKYFKYKEDFTFQS